MPAKKKNQMDSESDDPEMGSEEGSQDLSRFTNPNYSREFFATLPSEIKRRVRALQGLDQQAKKLYDEREKKMVEIKRKYEQLMQPIFATRADIVSGKADPTEAQVQKGFPEDHKDKVSLTEGEKSDKKCLPRFWLHALTHHRLINEMVNERDEGLLEDLIDVSTATLPPPAHGFTVKFAFNSNDFMEETELFKTFYMREEDEMIGLEKTECSVITWKEKKDLTKKTVTKKKPATKKQPAKYTTVTEDCESFFTFFVPMPPKPSFEEMDAEEQNLSLAETIRNKIVPNAIEYYTGEAPDGSSDMGDNDDEGEEEEEEEEEEPAEPPMRGRGRGGAAPPGKKSGKHPPAHAPQKECPTQ